MALPDLNLLVALDVLLTERSVARAAKRLQLSASATSRTLARLREATGDPLLVRAGRGLVPTPRALELQQEAGPMVQGATALLRPAAKPDLANIERTFVLRNREGFAEYFGPDLVSRVRAEAPGIRLWFIQKPDRDSGPLRDGSVDLETGVLGGALGPEVMTQVLFDDRFVGVVRHGHPLGEERVTPARFVSFEHIAVRRRARATDRLDMAMEQQRLKRNIAVIVDSYAAALTLARNSTMIAVVPERYTASLQTGLIVFPLPVPIPGITISMFWHPRLDADPVQRWLRQCVRSVCSNPVKSVW